MADATTSVTAPSASASPPAQPQAAAGHGNDEVLAAEHPVDDSASELNSIASSSTSVSSSVLDYRIENGRTYHRYKDGKYNYPNDERESDRLDLQHNLFLLTFDNRLGTAPPNDKNSQVKRVLDVGTGTGVWAIDFGEEHPDAEVLGIDLSAQQPDFAPPNVKFEIDDIEEPWTFSQPFDYIHSRMMTSSLANWRKYLQRCYDNLTPGGHLELNELELTAASDDGTLTEDHAIARSVRLLGEAMVKAGRAFQGIPELREMMVEIGFRDVTMQRYKWPTNQWPKHPKYKELGAWQNESLHAGYEAFTMAPYTRFLGWTSMEVQLFLIDVRKEINNRNIHAYWPIYSVVGRKPAKKESEPTS
ncbi:Secondary metabolism regulator LAE1 [Colletotrichum sidae]|uniref:Secondary metabolism regulator LAE1 n=1 Tax=Colletotrichum sidae TaxID=1347389 RepID=A0A4R8SPI3_9PEZI|nr:Secondary metabolism regulator LAE1 [Colletotrichum sidae]